MKIIKMDNQGRGITYNNGKIFVFGGYYNGMLLLQNTDENIEEKKIKTNNWLLLVFLLLFIYKIEEDYWNENEKIK